LGGSNVAGSTISGMTGPGMGTVGTFAGRRRSLLRKLLQFVTGGGAAPVMTPANTVVSPYGTSYVAPASGSFMIAAGAQIQCQFNISAGMLPGPVHTPELPSSNCLLLTTWHPLAVFPVSTHGQHMIRRRLWPQSI
jgi:hypothetical protein